MYACSFVITARLMDPSAFWALGAAPPGGGTVFVGTLDGGAAFGARFTVCATVPEADGGLVGTPALWWLSLCNKFRSSASFFATPDMAAAGATAAGTGLVEGIG
mmetsp:Transcript_2753/g.4840  ORF Transcript_2753/g.4840 Transcript_2753/m.4840 type:complete len:104 (+) Transcript_2753:1333-1644(+)